MTIVRLSRAEITRAWHQTSHSDIHLIPQELAKVHYNVCTGILETRQTAQEILEDSPRRILSHLPQRCLSLRKGITVLQPIPRLGLQPTTTSWPRQPFIRLPRPPRPTTGPTLATLRRFQVLTNLRMLRVSVILNFNTSTDLRVLFFLSPFLEKYVPHTRFCTPSIFSTCTYHHHRASYFTHGSDISNDVNIYLQTLRSLHFLDTIIFRYNQAYAAISEESNALLRFRESR